MSRHGGMNQSFVVDEFVSFGGLGFAIQNKAKAESLRLKNIDLLIGGMS